MAGMYGVALVSLLAAAALAPGARVDAGGGVSVRVPPGLHLIRRPLTDVTDPAQRLAVASFDVRLRAESCECGTPNVRNFPSDGAFVFAWEYEAPYSAASMGRIPRRPAAFDVGRGTPQTPECAGPSWVDDFRDNGRVLQVDVYLGPRAGPAVRGRVDALLDSLRVARHPVLRHEVYAKPGPPRYRRSV
jgi:hypothetical protein